MTTPAHPEPRHPLTPEHRNETERIGSISGSAHLSTEAGEVEITAGGSVSVEIAEHTVHLTLPIRLGPLGTELTVQLDRGELDNIVSGESTPEAP